MALATGTRLGAYEVLAAIGAGGMGQVYRARDTTLNRDVALKVLPDAFVLDPDRLARFKREAQLLASLNHPNIAAIYGLEESTPALVLELVEGPTLADRIALGPIPVEEALPLARQLAEAIEAAHDHGIIHRDLKPANIKLKVNGALPHGPDGGRLGPGRSAGDVGDCTVKVLDFGLAKALEPVGAGGNVGASAIVTSPAMTGIGMILGTAAYMSPEQAKGRLADKRSDVWAFGAVLYEMLSGRRAFTGEDVSETLAAVLRQDVDWAALPASTPAPVRHLIARCLDRDVRRRLRDIAEARIVLDDPAALAAPAAAAAPHSVAPIWRRAMPPVLAAFAGGALAGAAVWHFKPPAPLTVTRFQFTLPEGQSFSGVGRRMVDVSPDGAKMVYVANGRLHLRPMSQRVAAAIEGTEGHQAVTNPVFSPDGRSVAFHATSDQTLKRIAVSGGAAVTLCAAGMPFGMSWGPDGIVFAESGKGIRRVSPSGGTPEVLVTDVDGEESESPQMLPGGQHMLITVAAGTAPTRWDTAHVVAQSLATGERKIIVRGGADARYVATGHLMYAISGSVFAVPFDLAQLEATGSPVPVVAGVMRASEPSGAANFGVSGTGTLVYIPGPSSSSPGHKAIALADRRRGLELLRLPTGMYVAPRVAPDGRRIAFGSDDGIEANIYTYDLAGASGMQRLTFGGNNRFPIWTANDRVAFQSDREGDLAIWQSDIGGAAQRLTRPEPDTAHVPESWSPASAVVLFSVTKGADVALWMHSQDGKAAPFGEVRSSSPISAVFSPDGRWVAYSSMERNRATIYVQPVPPTGVQHQLPVGPSELAAHPLWSPDGKELFYNPGPGRFAWVGVTTHPTFAFGRAETAPRAFQTGPPWVRRAFDITPAGRFVGLTQAGQAEPGTPNTPQIQVVLNWFEELSARVPGAR